MNNPLVSVICVCFNQGNFIEEAVKSVLNQTYTPIEIILVDDGSTDNSSIVINKLKDMNPDIAVIQQENSGLCKAFNRGMAKSSGRFIVDLAADDIFHPHRIGKQVELFEKLADDYGVVFTDAEIIDEDGNLLRDHFDTVKNSLGIKKIPEGDIFYDLIDKFFVSAPTMLVKREVFDDLKGYDESLEYEDFDFWIRSSRKWKYGLLDRKLTKVRKHVGGMTANMYRKRDKKVESTFIVCKKIEKMIDDNRGRAALLRRVKYEFRMALKYGNFPWLKKWYYYYRDLGGSLRGLLNKN